MKALVYTGPEAMEMRDEAEPEAGDEVVIAVEACGICGSDMHAYLGHDERRPAPLVLGHEAAGRITAGPRAGERVAINPLVTCGKCESCLSGRSNICPDRQIISMPPRPGAFADFVRVPERNLVAVPDDLDLAVAALSEPIATSYHAVNLGERAAHRPLAASKVAVMGGGAIGLAAAGVLRSRGCKDILVAETNPLRRQAMARWDIAESYDPTAVGKPDDATFDIVVDAAGFDPTRAEACRLVKPGGVVMHIGLGGSSQGLDIRKMTLQEITFIGTYTYTMGDYRETLDGLHKGLFGSIDWFEERALDDGATAFQELRDGRVAAGKIVLRP